MKHEIRLTPSSPTQQVQLTFNPVAVAVMNNAAYAVLMRRGSQQIPTADSYDFLIPSGQYTVLPVVGREFAFSLDIYASGSPAYGQPCTLIFLGEGEAIPDFGSSTYRESQRVSGVLGAGASADYVIDTRGVRALYVEIIQDELVPQWWGTPNNLWCEVRSGTDGVTWNFIQLLNCPPATPVSRAIIPVADRLTQLLLRNATPGNRPYIIKWTLLDSPADLPLRPFTVLHRTQFVPSNPVVWGTFNLAGVVREIDVHIASSPGADFAFRLTLNNGVPFNPAWEVVIDNRSLSSVEYNHGRAPYAADGMGANGAGYYYRFFPNVLTGYSALLTYQSVVGPAPTLYVATTFELGA